MSASPAAGVPAPPPPPGRPKVSVCMVTYNHARFIGQAIESVLTQQVDFAVELVIGEDCSPDDTRAVIADYQRRYPGVIRLVTGERNVGAQPNFIRTYQACTGEYVAMLEGDDYWTDPYKLRDQVALLDADPGAVLCFADCAEVDEQGRELKSSFVPATYRRDLSQRDIIHDYCPPTLSVLFRNRVLPSLPASFAVVRNGDYFLFSMLTDYGRAVFLPRVVASYRRHGGGVWSAQSQEQQFRNNLKTKLAMLDYFGPAQWDNVLPAINWYYTQLGALLWQQPGRRAEFWALYRAYARVWGRTRTREFVAFTWRLLRGQLAPAVLLAAPTAAGAADAAA